MNGILRRLPRRLFAGALGVVMVLSVSASTADAGVIPWLVDSLFGPVRGPYQPGYGSYYGAYGCPPAGTTYAVPQPSAARTVVTSPGYGQTYYGPYYRTGYGAGYGAGCPTPCGPAPCLPRIPNILPGLLGGLFGCGPCYSPYGYSSFGGGYGCSPCGFGGCPVTIPSGAASGGGATTTGWQRATTTPKTFVDGPTAAGDDAVDTRTFRPPVDPDSDPGEVIPQVKRPRPPVQVKPPTSDAKSAPEKTPVTEDNPGTEKAPPEEKKPATALRLPPPVHHVVPSRTRMARRRVGPVHPVQVVISRQQVPVRDGLRPVLPGSTIAGR